MEAVYGQVVADWVNARMPFPIDFGPHEAIGYHREGRLVCGAVFNNLHRKVHGDSVEVTFAADAKGLRPALDNGVLRALFWYGFNCSPRITRLQAVTARDNRPARQFLEHLGFTREGSHRRGWDGRTASISYGMLRENCRWLNEQQESAVRPVAA